MTPSLRDRFAGRLAWPDLAPEPLRALIALAREEDLSGIGLACPPARPGDPTSDWLDPRAPGLAEMRARHPLVACGLLLVPLILEAYGGRVAFQPRARDGDSLPEGAILGVFQGPAAEMLRAERVLLNFVQRLSGVATATARHVAALGPTTTRLLDTRKTTPGFRLLEKYAVACGGGYNHRLGLFDRILIKDNHLAAAGATSGNRLAEAVRTARRARPDLLVEVEVDDLAQVPPVLEAGADAILLDNFDDARLTLALDRVAGRALTEASGGITLERLPALGRLGLDFVSTGAPVHHSSWCDLGLDWASAAG